MSSSADNILSPFAVEQDVYSYNMEQAHGIAGVNVVTVLMCEHGIGLQEALDRVGAHFTALMNDFTSAKEGFSARSFGEPALDAAIARFVGAMEYWIIGNLNLSFETQRYFGPECGAVKKTKVVVLQPRVSHGTEDGEDGEVGMRTKGIESD